MPDSALDPTKPIIVNPAAKSLANLPEKWLETGLSLQDTLDQPEFKINYLHNDLAIPMPEFGIWVMFSLYGIFDTPNFYRIGYWPQDPETGLPDVADYQDIDAIEPWDIDEGDEDYLIKVHKALWPWIQHLTTKPEILSQIKEELN